jgi:hypothetical protein
VTVEPILGLDGGFEDLAALVSAVAVLVGVFLVIERMLEHAAAAADAIRGRDHCHYCGARLPSRDGFGYESRCRRCERGQPWR